MAISAKSTPFQKMLEIISEITPTRMVIVVYVWKVLENKRDGGRVKNQRVCKCCKTRAYRLRVVRSFEIGYVGILCDRCCAMVAELGMDMMFGRGKKILRYIKLNRDLSPVVMALRICDRMLRYMERKKATGLVQEVEHGEGNEA